MNLTQAFDSIEQWSREGIDAGACVHRYDYVLIDRGGIQRGFTSCPVCGAMTNMGFFVISHDDGRRVLIDLPLYHYAQVGHPISKEQLDSELLFSILADAQKPPASLVGSTLTLKDAMAQIRDIQENGEQVGKSVRRAGHVMVKASSLQGGTQYCMECGEPLGKGTVTVVHEDRRIMTFDVSMFHYVEAGHPFTPRQLDSTRLLAMMADQASVPRAPRAITIGEALQRVAEIEKNGQRADDPFLRRAGRISVYFGAVEMGLKPCPHCGALTGMGKIIVTHDDGRRVTCDPALYHYVEAGHPISETLAADLIAIVSDQ